MFDFILFACAFFILLPASKLFRIWQSLLTVEVGKFTEENLTVWEGFVTPSYMSDLIDDIRPTLQTLGFDYIATLKFSTTHYYELSDTQTGNRHEMPIMGFQKINTHFPEGYESTTLEILPPMDVNVPNQLLYSIVTTTATDQTIITSNLSPLNEMLKTPNFNAHTLFTGSLEALYNAHCQRLNQLNMSAIPAEHDTAQSVLQACVESNRVLLDENTAAGNIALHKKIQQTTHSTQENLSNEQYRFTFFSAFKHAMRMYVDAKKRHYTELNEAPVSQPRQTWFFNMSSLQESIQPTKADQWKLFLLTLVVSIVIGRLVFDWVTLFILTAVIIFHELGHFFAMRLFGYGKTRIYMLPLVGGVAIGHEKQINYNHRGWMTLMGPLPGIILGVWLYLQNTVPEGYFAHEWFRTAAIMLIFVNLFNLLPLYPLDGGKLLDYVLPSHAHKFKKYLFIALLVCGLGIFLWAGTYIIVMFLAFLLYVVVRQPLPTQEPVQPNQSQLEILHGLVDKESNPFILNHLIERSKTLHMEARAVSLAWYNRLIFSLVIIATLVFSVAFALWLAM